MENQQQTLPQTRIGETKRSVSAVFSAVQVDGLTALSPSERDFIRWQMNPKGGTPQQAVLYTDEEKKETVVVLGTVRDGRFVATRIYPPGEIGMNFAGVDVSAKPIEMPLGEGGLPAQGDATAFAGAVRAAVQAGPLQRNVQFGFGPFRVVIDNSKAHLSNESDMPTEQVGTRLDQQISEGLNGHDGIFLGEYHDKPAMVESVAKLLPRYRAEGVTAVAYELPQSVLDRISACHTLDDVAKACPAVEPEKMRPLFELAQSCKRCGITLLGYENPETLGQEQQFTKKEYTEEEALTLVSRLNYAQSENGMNSRDSWSVAYLREHRPPGKLIMIGGAGHGKAQDIAADKGYRGINNRLGFLSIDEFPLVPGTPLRNVGQIYKPEHHGADKMVGLPPSVVETFRRMDITSWPPSPDRANDVLPLPVVRVPLFIRPAPGEGPPPPPLPEGELPPAPPPPDEDFVPPPPAPPRGNAAPPPPPGDEWDVAPPPPTPVAPPPSAKPASKVAGEGR